MSTKELIEKVESIQNILMSRATGGTPFNEEYKNLRTELIHTPEIKDDLPKFLTTCRDLDQFWSFIKAKFATYSDRRNFISENFGAIFIKLESYTQGYPSDQTTSEIIQTLTPEYIQKEWSKALERRFSDPEGAITSARTLLETVCKYILDTTGEKYDDKEDLPKLYSLASAKLNLSPSQHTEQIFKEILSGSISVIKGLGSLRNKLSDSHGKGIKHVKPSQRHAGLAVNIAGAMSTFLLETLELHK